MEPRTSATPHLHAMWQACLNAPKRKLGDKPPSTNPLNALNNSINNTALQRLGATDGNMGRDKRKEGDTVVPSATATTTRGRGRPKKVRGRRPASKVEDQSVPPPVSPAAKAHISDAVSGEPPQAREASARLFTSRSFASSSPAKQRMRKERTPAGTAQLKKKRKQSKQSKQAAENAARLEAAIRPTIHQAEKVTNYSRKGRKGFAKSAYVDIMLDRPPFNLTSFLVLREQYVVEQLAAQEEEEHAKRLAHPNEDAVEPTPKAKQQQTQRISNRWKRKGVMGKKCCYHRQGTGLLVEGIVGDFGSGYTAGCVGTGANVVNQQPAEDCTVTATGVGGGSPSGGSRHGDGNMECAIFVVPEGTWVKERRVFVPPDDPQALARLKELVANTAIERLNDVIVEVLED